MYLDVLANKRTKLAQLSLDNSTYPPFSCLLTFILSDVAEVKRC